MSKFWAWLRSLKAGEWIALLVVLGGAVFVLAQVAADTWAIMVGSLQPEMIKVKNTDYDLIAQRSMSAAAWWMVGVSLFSSIVGGVGLYLLYRNLREAQRTAENGLAAVRAYISVDFVKVYEDVKGNLVVTYKYTNSGVSPAKDVAISVLLLCREQNDDDVPNITQMEIVKSRSDCPAGSKRAGKTRFPLEIVHKASGFGPVLIETTIEVSYLDVFGQLQTVPARYGRVLHPIDFGTEQRPKSLYREVGRGIGWGT